VLLDGRAVFGLLANVQNATMNFGVQGLYAAVEHLGKTSEIGDVQDGEPGFAQDAGSAAVETSSTPWLASSWAKGTSPVFSVTLRSARRTFL